MTIGQSVLELASISDLSHFKVKACILVSCCVGFLLVSQTRHILIAFWVFRHDVSSSWKTHSALLLFICLSTTHVSATPYPLCGYKKVETIKIRGFISGQKLETIQMSIDRVDNRLWFVYTMEYYTRVKMNEPQLYVTKWINLRNKIFSKKSIFAVWYLTYKV